MFSAQGEESKAHCTRYVTARGRTGFSSSPSPIRLLFSICSRPMAAVQVWGGLSYSGSPPPPTFPACVLPSPWCDRQSVKNGALWRCESQPGVRRQHRFNRMGRRFEDHCKHWPAQQMLLHDMMVGCTASLQGLLSHLQPTAGEMHLRGTARELSTNVVAQLYSIKESCQCAHSRGNCAMGTTVNTLNLFYNSIRQIWNSCSVCSSFPVAMSSFFTCCKRNWWCWCLQNYPSCTYDF